MLPLEAGGDVLLSRTPPASRGLRHFLAVVDKHLSSVRLCADFSFL